MSEQAIVEVREWEGKSGNGDQGLLNWMGRKSENHMPEGTWLCQNFTKGDALPGDVDENASFTLAFHGRTRGDWAEPGDFVCKMEDGTFEARKKELIDLLKQDGEVRFYSRDFRDELATLRRASKEKDLRAE